MGETDSADKFMVLVVVYTYLFLLKQWEERVWVTNRSAQVIIKEIDGKKWEPIEELTIDLPETLQVER
jgi:GTP-binding protein